MLIVFVIIFLALMAFSIRWVFRRELHSGGETSTTPLKEKILKRVASLTKDTGKLEKHLKDISGCSSSKLDVLLNEVLAMTRPSNLTEFFYITQTTDTVIIPKIKPIVYRQESEFADGDKAIILAEMREVLAELNREKLYTDKELLSILNMPGNKMAWLKFYKKGKEMHYDLLNIRVQFYLSTKTPESQEMERIRKARDQLLRLMPMAALMKAQKLASAMVAGANMRAAASAVPRLSQYNVADAALLDDLVKYAERESIDRDTLMAFVADAQLNVMPIEDLIQELKENNLPRPNPNPIIIEKIRSTHERLRSGDGYVSAQSNGSRINQIMIENNHRTFVNSSIDSDVRLDQLNDDQLNGVIQAVLPDARGEYADTLNMLVETGVTIGDLIDIYANV